MNGNYFDRLGILVVIFVIITNYIYAQSEKGASKVLWKTNTNAEVVSNPGVSKSNVYLTVRDSEAKLVCFNKIAGKIAWIYSPEKEINIHLNASPVIYDGRVFVILGGVICAINARPGQKIWSKNWRYKHVRGDPIFAIYNNGLITIRNCQTSLFIQSFCFYKIDIDSGLKKELDNKISYDRNIKYGLSLFVKRGTAFWVPGNVDIPLSSGYSLSLPNNTPNYHNIFKNNRY